MFSAVRERLEGGKTTGLRSHPTRAEDTPAALGVLSRVFVFLWDRVNGYAESTSSTVGRPGLRLGTH